MIALASLILPLDFIRVFWIVTAFDVVAAIILYKQLLSNRLPFHVTVAFVLFTVYALFLLLSAFFNMDYLSPHMNLIIGTALSLMKAAAFYTLFFDNRAQTNIKFIFFSFLLINIALLIYYTLGFGQTGSGRFSGFFPQSNGLAAYACFAFATSLFYARIENVFAGIGGSIAAAAIVVLSGSRGSFLMLGIILLINIATSARSSITITAISSALFSFIVLVWAFAGFDHILGSLANALSAADVSSAGRLADFLRQIAQGGLSADLDPSRTDLYVEAVAHYVAEPVFWGHGFGSSAHLSSIYLGTQIHNTFLIALYELGVPVFLFLLGFVILFIFYFARNVTRPGVRALVAIWGLVVILQGMKTPYYLLNGISWFVILAVTIDWVKPTRLPNASSTLRKAEKCASISGSKGRAFPFAGKLVLSKR